MFYITVNSITPQSTFIFTITLNRSQVSSGHGLVVGVDDPGLVDPVHDEPVLAEPVLDVCVEVGAIIKVVIGDVEVGNMVEVVEVAEDVEVVAMVGEVTGADEDGARVEVVA